MDIHCFHQTDIGQVRKHNEDFYLVDEDEGLYVVCDGMGGHAAGEVASQLTAQTLVSFLKSKIDKKDLERAMENKASRTKIQEMIEESIAEANRQVRLTADLEPEKKGMGTTVVVALRASGGFFISHIGDSRCYLVRNGECHQITEDHSYVNDMVKAGLLEKGEAEKHPQAHALTRAVGVAEITQPDHVFIETQDKDKLIICSDGLSGHLQDQEFSQVFQKTPLEQSPKHFIDMANQRGGKDNITVVILAIGRGDGPPLHPEAVSADRKVALMKKVPLFKNLTHKEIAKVLEISELISFAQKESLIIEEGREGNDMFVLLKGSVQVSLAQKDLALLKPGQFFGEMALIDKEVRSATIKSVGPVKALKFNREEFLGLIKREPRMGLKLLWSFLRKMNQRLRDMGEQIRHL